jgi:hypothetical protein
MGTFILEERPSPLLVIRPLETAGVMVVAGARLLDRVATTATLQSRLVLVNEA